MSSAGPTEPSWVLDTSVAVAWLFTDESQHEPALRVREATAERPEAFLVPPLFHSELVHVLARKSGRDEPFVRETLEIFLRLGIPTLPLSTAALVRTAHWACRGLGGYDATFVALAEDLDARWLTADERAAGVAGDRRAVPLGSWRP